MTDKKRDPYSAWLIRAEQMQDILVLSDWLNIRKPALVRLIFKYVLFFTEQNFIAQANAGELRGKCTHSETKLMLWMQPILRAELNVALGRIDTAKTESDVYAWLFLMCLITIWKKIIHIGIIASC